MEPADGGDGLNAGAVSDDHGIARFDFGFVDDSFLDDDELDAGGGKTGSQGAGGDSGAGTGPPKKAQKPYVAVHHVDGWFHSELSAGVRQLFGTKFGPTQIRQAAEHDYLHGRWERALENAALYVECAERSAKVMGTKELLEIAALAALKLGRTAEALEYVERMGATNEAGHHYLRGQVCIAAGKSLQAVEHWMDSLDIRRRDPNVWKKLGEAFRRMENYSLGGAGSGGTSAGEVGSRCLSLAKSLLLQARWPAGNEGRRDRLVADIDNILAQRAEKSCPRSERPYPSKNDEAAREAAVTRALKLLARDETRAHAEEDGENAVRVM